MRVRPSKRSSGFTLVELVIVITLIGIVAVGSARFIRGAMSVYEDVTEREAIISSARFAVERFSRELATAVPNSVRIGGNTSVHCIEFVPINWNTFYLTLPSVGEASPEVDVIELSNIDNALYVPDSGDFAIVYPLLPSHVYDASFNRRQTITSCSDDGDGNCATSDDADKVVQLGVGDGFAQSSPSQRLYIADRAISYCVRDSNLYRHENGIQAVQTLFTAGGQLMAEGITNPLSASPGTSPSVQNPFSSLDATASRNALTRANFLFTRNEEQISFVREINVPNVP